MLDQQQDQHEEDFATTETQYSTNVHNAVFMLTSLMHHQLIDYQRKVIFRSEDIQVFVFSIIYQICDNMSA